MKVIYRKFPKTASSPVTCHPVSYSRVNSEWERADPERSVRYVALCALNSSCTGLVMLKSQRAPHLRRKNEWLDSGIEVGVVQTPRESSLFGHARE